MPFAVDLAQVAPAPHVIAPPAAATVWRPVVVRPGDTVWQLAITHRTTPDAIAAKNQLRNGGATIRVGQTLLVPGPAAATPAPRPAASATSKAPAVAAPTGGVYAVRAGDTLSEIAKKYKVSVGVIASANRLTDPGLIFIGQRLTIPGTAGTAGTPVTSPAAPAPAAPKPAASTSARMHTVVAGDSMSAIAQKYNVSLTKLLAANRVANPALIHIGQQITIPSATAATSTPTSTSTSANTFAGYTYSNATVGAASANRAALAAMSLPNRTDTAAMIRSTALRHGVDPKLALAIGWQESGWSQGAVSVANAVGVMQIMPISGVWASELAGRKINLLDTQDNITAGVLIIRALQSSASSREQAIAAYYQGLYSVRTKGLYSDTKSYVASVLAHYARM